MLRTSACMRCFAGTRHPDPGPRSAPDSSALPASESCCTHTPATIGFKLNPFNSNHPRGNCGICFRNFRRTVPIPYGREMLNSSSFGVRVSGFGFTCGVRGLLEKHFEIQICRSSPFRPVLTRTPAKSAVLVLASAKVDCVDICSKSQLLVLTVAPNFWSQRRVS